MSNRPFWSAIWPEKLTRDKKTVLADMGFEYDSSGDTFVHRRLRKVISFDAVCDMNLDELSDFGRGSGNETEVRLRDGVTAEHLDLLMKRYGWA